jgi:crotonobetainyl-CoA:carnitine CoA-transferase CaiB-like acyl-CoA transferase
MTSGAASQLQTGVDAVHAAVASGDRTQAVQALASLQATVTQLRHQAQVSSDRAAAILGAAADVEAQLGLMPTTTTTSTTTTTPDHPPKKGPKGGD